MAMIDPAFAISTEQLLEQLRLTPQPPMPPPPPPEPIPLLTEEESAQLLSDAWVTRWSISA